MSVVVTASADTLSSWPVSGLPRAVPVWGSRIGWFGRRRRRPGGFSGAGDGRERPDRAGMADEWGAMGSAGVGFQSRIVPSSPAEARSRSPAAGGHRERPHRARMAGEWVAVWGAGVGFQSPDIASSPAEARSGSPVLVAMTASARTGPE